MSTIDDYFELNFKLEPLNGCLSVWKLLHSLHGANTWTGGVKWFQFQATEPVCLHSLEFNEHKIKIEQVKRMLWHTHSLTHCGTIQLRLTCAIHFHLARVVFLATTGANYRSNYTAAVQNKTCFYLTRQVVRVEKLNIAWLNADSSEIVVCKFATILLAKDEHSINIDSALATELVPDWTWIWLEEREWDVVITRFTCLFNHQSTGHPHPSIQLDLDPN